MIKQLVSFAILALIFATNVQAERMYWRTSFTGGGTALDGISYLDGPGKCADAGGTCTGGVCSTGGITCYPLASWDSCVVSGAAGRALFYYDEDCTEPEAAADHIQPDDNPGPGCWQLSHISASQISDITDVGSGRIISTTERTELGTATAHITASDPHQDYLPADGSRAADSLNINQAADGVGLTIYGSDDVADRWLKAYLSKYGTAYLEASTGITLQVGSGAHFVLDPVWTTFFKPLRIADDTRSYIGNAMNYWSEYSTFDDRLEIWTTNGNGSGADTLLLSVNDGETTVNVHGEVNVSGPGSFSAITAQQLTLGPQPVGTTGELSLPEDPANPGGNTVGWKAPADIPATIKYVLPALDGTVGQVLATDGAAHTSWAAAVDPASPGPLGGTTPDSVDATDISADSYTTNPGPAGTSESICLREDVASPGGNKFCLQADTSINADLSILVPSQLPSYVTPCPATASESCQAGQQCYDAAWQYICVAANTWRRAALAAW